MCSMGKGRKNDALDSGTPQPGPPRGGPGHTTDRRGLGPRLEVVLERDGLTARLGRLRRRRRGGRGRGGGRPLPAPPAAIPVTRRPTRTAVTTTPVATAVTAGALTARFPT